MSDADEVQKPVTADAPAGGAATPNWRDRFGFKRWVFLALLVAGAAVLGHVWYGGSQVDPHEYTPAELEEGPVTQIISWDGGRTAVQVSRLSPLPADHLWRVVTDQGRFNEFMPYVRETSVQPGPDGLLIERQKLELPHASYELELGIRLSERGNVRTARWEQRQGTLRFNQGAWIVQSHGDRNVLRYQVSASLTGVPQWLVNYAMRRRVGRLLDAVEARVRDMQQREPDYFGS
jgi:hypothetical protein